MKNFSYLSHIIFLACLKHTPVVRQVTGCVSYCHKKHPVTHCVRQPGFLKHIIFLLLFLPCGLLFAGCAGPLDEATRQILDSTFTGNTYQAKVYLGNRYPLEYTNNSVKGRSPTGVFIDQSLHHWYETDASFWEPGTSGHEYTLEELQQIDRDLNFGTFGQGILPGQLVVIKKINDKKDQVILEVQTVVRYEVRKTYGVSTRSKAKPRASRIHCIFGKEEMQAFNPQALNRMLEQLLKPAPAPVTEEQKQEFIRSNFSGIPLDDLVKLTGFFPRKILELHYRHILSQTRLASNLQKKMRDVLVKRHKAWSQDSGIRIQGVRVENRSLEVDCAIQEISDSVIYHSPELRAALIFFKKVIPLAKPLGTAVIPEDLDSSFQKLNVTFSYLYFDEEGRRIPERITCSIQAEALHQFADAAITEQELADHSEILMGTTPVNISLSALKAVETVNYSGPTTWKEVRVKFRDWDSEEDTSEDLLTITGEVQNTGTWIAKNVIVTAKGYDKYGFPIRSEYTTLYGLLKPGEMKSFTIKMNSENLKKFELFLRWEEVE